MGKVFFAVILTLMAWYLGASYGARMNLIELGNLAAITVMGACIIYYNEEKKKS